jgi:hypothetical protein
MRLKTGKQPFMGFYGFHDDPQTPSTARPLPWTPTAPFLTPLNPLDPRLQAVPYLISPTKVDNAPRSHRLDTYPFCFVPSPHVISCVPPPSFLLGRGRVEVRSARGVVSIILAQLQTVAVG